LFGKATHKYVIEFPTSIAIDDATRIDGINENRFWQDAIVKEMRNLSVTFEILENGQSEPIGLTFVFLGAN